MKVISVELMIETWNYRNQIGYIICYRSGEKI